MPHRRWPTPSRARHGPRARSDRTPALPTCKTCRAILLPRYRQHVISAFLSSFSALVSDVVNRIMADNTGSCVCFGNGASNEVFCRDFATEHPRSHTASNERLTRSRIGLPLLTHPSMIVRVRVCKGLWWRMHQRFLTCACKKYMQPTTARAVAPWATSASSSGPRARGRARPK